MSPAKQIRILLARELAVHDCCGVEIVAIHERPGFGHVDIHESYGLGVVAVHGGFGGVELVAIHGRPISHMLRSTSLMDLGLLTFTSVAIMDLLLFMSALHLGLLRPWDL